MSKLFKITFLVISTVGTSQAAQNPTSNIILKFERENNCRNYEQAHIHVTAAIKLFNYAIDDSMCGHHHDDDHHDDDHHDDHHDDDHHDDHHDDDHHHHDDDHHHHDDDHHHHDDDHHDDDHHHHDDDHHDDDHHDDDHANNNHYHHGDDNHHHHDDDVLHVQWTENGWESLYKPPSGTFEKRHMLRSPVTSHDGHGSHHDFEHTHNIEIVAADNSLSNSLFTLSVSVLNDKVCRVKDIERRKSLIEQGRSEWDKAIRSLSNICPQSDCPEVCGADGCIMVDTQSIDPEKSENRVLCVNECAENAVILEGQGAEEDEFNVNGIPFKVNLEAAKHMSEIEDDIVVCVPDSGQQGLLRSKARYIKTPYYRRLMRSTKPREALEEQQEARKVYQEALASFNAAKKEEQEARQEEMDVKNAFLASGKTISGRDGLRKSSDSNDVKMSILSSENQALKEELEAKQIYEDALKSFNEAKMAEIEAKNAYLVQTGSHSRRIKHQMRRLEAIQKLSSSNEYGSHDHLASLMPQVQQGLEALLALDESKISPLENTLIDPSALGEWIDNLQKQIDEYSAYLEMKLKSSEDVLAGRVPDDDTLTLPIYVNNETCN